MAQWDDFSFLGDSGGSDFSGSDFGSFSPTDYSFGGGGLDSGLDTSGIGGGLGDFSAQLQDPTQGMSGYGGAAQAGAAGAPAGAPMGQGSAAPGVIPGMGGMGGLNSLQGLLGLGGAGAGLIGALMGGGVTGTTMPQIGTAQKAAINQAGQQMQPFIQGSSPLQMQQQQLLTALANGQIPPEMANLVARAYDPQYQQATTRATEGARNAGFYDAPLSSPVGGAIMGPAAAQLQGQQANSLLGLMQTMPGLYNTPIQQQIGAAGQQSGNLLQGAQLGTGQQTSKPLGAQIGQGVGGALQGASQAVGQNNFATQLGRFMQGQGGIGTTGSYY